MASIKSVIQLTDLFSDPLSNIVNAVNSSIPVIDEMQAVMNRPIDTSSMNLLQSQIDEVTEAARQFDAAMQNVSSPSISVQQPKQIEIPVTSGVENIPQLNIPETVNVPVTPVITEQPKIDVPDSMDVLVTPIVTEQPQIDIPDDVYIEVSTSGVPTVESQIADLTNRLNGVTEMQNAINNVGRNLYVLPENSEKEVASVNREISRMQAAIEFLETNPFNIDSSIAEMQIRAISDSLDEVIAQQQQIDNAMGNMPSQVMSVQVQAETPEAVQIPIQWQSDSLEVFTSSGVERFQQEVASVNSMLQDLNQTQSHITQAAAESEVLSPQARYDVEAVENRIQALQQSIERVEENPLNIGSDSANASLEQLRARVSKTLELQENLNAAMQGADISEINAAYLRLSQNISEAKRMVRDSFENIPPVEIPVTWQSDSLEVFTNTGVERFRQETQSANNMLNTLNQTQSRIAETAAQIDLFPANAVADISNMQSRLQAIQQRIQAIENNPLNMGSDVANNELEQLRAQLNQAVSEQQELNTAVDNMDVRAANEAYLRLSQTIGSTERYIRDNIDEQGRFNCEIEQGRNEANELMQTIKDTVAAYATIQTMGNVIELSDTITQTTARLNLIVDDGGSVEELQNKIFASAQASRGSYLATADAVYKLNAQASQAFSSNDEIITFTELLNKQFTIAGTEVQGINAAMLQLTQAMASGRLQGDELTSILENATPVVQNIQRYLQEVEGIDASNIKDLAADGQITAEIIRNSMFYAADEINAKFEQMPKTFSQIWQSFQNTALMAFQPVLQRMNEIANSEAFQNMVNGAIEALFAVSNIALEVFDLLVSIASVVVDNWSWLSPVIYGVATALGVYTAALIVNNAVQAINTMQKRMAVIQAVAHGAAITAEMTATTGLTAAQLSFNAALYACPITWIIIVIIALISLFYAAVAAVNKFAGTSVSATGIICGVFMFAAAAIGNLFVALINFVIDIFVVLWNFIVAFANFFANVFNDPVGAIARLFFDLVDTVLSLLQSLASAIDTVFGSNLAGAVSGWRDSLGGWVDKTFGRGAEVIAKMNTDDIRLRKFEYGSAWDAGYSFGKGIDESISNFDPSNLFDTNVPGAGDYADLSNYGAGLGGIGGGVDDIAGNTGKIADSMDITEEDLKYLRDIAEQEAINRFTTAEIRIEQTNHNNINSDMDLDGVIDGLTDAVDEAVEIVTEGVHV